MDIEAKRIGVRVLLQLIQLCLQFGDGLFEVELMFHTRIIGIFGEAGNAVFASLAPLRSSAGVVSVRQRAGLFIRLLVVMRFTRLHPGAQKGNAANYLVAARTALQAKPLC